MKKILLFVTTLCLLIVSISFNSSAAKAKTETINFSKPIGGVLQKGSKSYKFDVTYTTDFMFVAYVGNTEADNDMYLDGYSINLYDNKNKKVATYRKVISSAKMSYLDNKDRKYAYQIINKKLKRGSYTLKITSNIKDEQNYSIFLYRHIYGGDVKVSSLKANVKSPQPTNKSISLSTKAKGSYLQYKYSVINKTKNTKAKVIRKYSANKTAKWKPTVAGTYIVKVTVKNTKSEKTSSKTIKYVVNNKAETTSKGLK